MILSTATSNDVLLVPNKDIPVPIAILLELLGPRITTTGWNIP